MEEFMNLELNSGHNAAKKWCCECWVVGSKAFTLTLGLDFGSRHPVHVVHFGNVANFGHQAVQIVQVVYDYNKSTREFSAFGAHFQLPEVLLFSDRNYPNDFV
jgi:hypothetical protein